MNCLTSHQQPICMWTVNVIHLACLPVLSSGAKTELSYPYALCNTPSHFWACLSQPVIRCQEWTLLPPTPHAQCNTLSHFLVCLPATASLQVPRMNCHTPTHMHTHCVIHSLTFWPVCHCQPWGARAALQGCTSSRWCRTSSCVPPPSGRAQTRCRRQTWASCPGRWQSCTPSGCSHAPSSRAAGRHGSLHYTSSCNVSQSGLTVRC